ncbi:hypothetical protein NUACC21_17030 [Scytonema sp. NUACC21]
MEELMEFIQANPDPRELKRALAVKMVMQNYPVGMIGNNDSNLLTLLANFDLFTLFNFLKNFVQIDRNFFD